MEEKKTLIGRIRSNLKIFWKAIRPDENAWKGARLGLAVVTLGLLIAFAGSVAMGPWGWIALLVLPILFTLLAFLSGSLADLILNILNGIPANYRLVLIGSLVVLMMAVFGTHNLLGTAVLVAAVIIPASLLGAGVYVLARSGWRNLTTLRRGIAIGSIVLGASGLAGGLAWYLWPGPQIEPVINAAWHNEVTVTPLDAEDPSQPGPYSVRTLTYGSGEDIRRPEFGENAELLTPQVDGSPFIKNWSGISGDLRSRYWGFDVRALPLNGRVWYPDGEGPFPLVLIVHGNHFMMDYSDPGYDYLGELLASRGMILVSVDQNFLNGSYTNIRMFGIEGLKEENDGRAWLLLEHLAKWHAWNQTSGNPFYGKVDVDRIALIGHSRGGEAAAIAAAFNRLPYYPDDGSVRFDYNFNIRSVVAIAPSDGQYKPTGRYTPLHDVNYFVLQGAYDGDVRPFLGIGQYNRVEFSAEGDWFKTALYIDQANHGQFNTRWGRADLDGFPARGLLNLTPIMPEADQKQVARVFISAFLEATLNQADEYIPLFRDPRQGRDWLPDTVYLTRFADTKTEIIANYDEDIDLTTASRPGAAFQANHLTLWYEKLVELKFNDQQTNAVFLGWDTPAMGEIASYILKLNEQPYTLSGEDALIFSMADANLEPNPKRMGNAGGASVSDRTDKHQPIDLTIELEDGSGNTASLPLSHFSKLQPQIEFSTLKASFLERRDTRHGEVVFQSFAFPLADFLANNPRLNLDDLAEVRFVFDRSQRGVVVLDEIGFQR